MRTLDKVGVKAALGKVGRTLLGLGKGAVWTGGLAKALIQLVNTETGLPKDGRSATTPNDVANKFRDNPTAAAKPASSSLANPNGQVPGSTHR
jgi:hypothetical protein